MIIFIYIENCFVKLKAGNMAIREPGQMGFYRAIQEKLEIDQVKHIQIATSVHQRDPGDCWCDMKKP